jgi:transcriptional regulator with XRE-family HTH domain
MQGPPFAQRLKQARQKAGLSQLGLAEKAGLTAPYVSLLESGRRRPPSPPVIQRLAAALGLAPEPWFEQAALERSPGPIRKRLEGLDGERRKVQRARDKILSTALYRLSRHPGLVAGLGEPPGPDTAGLGQVLGKLAPRLRAVGSAREAGARSEEILAAVAPAERERLLDALPDVLPGTDAAPDAPPITRPVEVRASLDAAAPALDVVHLDARWAGPRAFLWRVDGDDGYPRLEAGDLLLVEPDCAPKDGDLVALRLGGRDQARVLHRRGDETRLDALRPEVPPLRLSAADLEAGRALILAVSRVIRSFV